MSDYIRGLREKIGHDLLVVPGCAAVIFNDRGEVLLQRRVDDGEWALPAGIIEPGETPAETVVREVYEETGLRVVPIRVTGVYGGGDEWMHDYPNGDKTAVISITFECHVVGGVLQPVDGESSAVGYFALNALPSPMREVHRLRIHHAITQRDTYFKLPG